MQEINDFFNKIRYGEISSVILLVTSSQFNSRGHASNITCPRMECHMPKVTVELNRAPTIIQNAFHAFWINKKEEEIWKRNQEERHKYME